MPAKFNGDIFHWCDVQPNGCWVWVRAVNKGGYGVLIWRGKKLLAHRYSWQYFRGEIPAGMAVCHKCDNPPCVNPEHLFLGTTSDNTRDMIRKGRDCWSTGARRKVLDNEITTTIHLLLENGLSQSGVARLLGISRSSVRLAITKSPIDCNRSNR